MNKYVTYLNGLGFIPMDNESIEEFIERSNKTLDYTKNKYNNRDILKASCLDNCYYMAKDYFDMDPSWVPVFSSNKSLLFLHGGCTWLIDDIPIIQIRKEFKNSNNYLWIKKKEVLIHEYIHVIRGQVKSYKYEEGLCSIFCKNYIRKILNFAFSKKIDYALFFGLNFLFVFYLFYLSINFEYKYYSNINNLLYCGIVAPIISFSIGFFRFRIIKKCMSKLKNIFKNPMAVLLRMNDNEIDKVAKNNKNIFDTFKGVRWDIINSNYKIK